MNSHKLTDTFSYFDLRRRLMNEHIDILFPEWQGQDEHLVVLSPHDDDALLGAGYLMLAARAHGAAVSVVIFCDGSAGYSELDERQTIVAVRRDETHAAYARLGLDAGSIHRLDYPDFSIWSRVGWQLPGGGTGSFAATIPLLRKLHVTRLLIPNGHREHADHEAVARIGAFDGPQVGDPIIAEWGAPSPVRTVLSYAVWSDFSPEDALVSGVSCALRANRAVAAPADAEQKIVNSLDAFASQGQIISDLVKARRARRLRDGRYLELYYWFDPRPRLEYAPYRHAAEEIVGSTLRPTTIVEPVDGLSADESESVHFRAKPR